LKNTLGMASICFAERLQWKLLIFAISLQNNWWESDNRLSDWVSECMSGRVILVLNQQLDYYNTPVRHIIPIPSKPVFALALHSVYLGGKQEIHIS
jgi:hypothetical protein